MSHKKTYTILKVVICNLLFLIVFAACKKVETTKTYTVTNTASQSTIASDEVTINNEFDQFVDDAIKVLSNHSAIITGAYPPDSVSPGVIEITYSGRKYDSTKTRSGVDSIHYNSKVPWGIPGSTATLTFEDRNQPLGYEVFYYSILPPSNDTASLTFLGSITITNVSGGALQNITPGDSMVVHIRASNVSFTFNDQAAVIQLYSLNVNELRTFTTNGSTLYAKTRGDTSMNNNSQNVGSWGTNRLGNNYYSAITAPIVQNVSNLNLSYNPIGGTKVIEGILQPISSVYGVTQQGVVQTSGIPYGYYSSWVNNNLQQTDILPYYY